MCRIDNQLKTLIHLKYSILILFSLYSVDILVLHTLNTLSSMFSGISNIKFFFFGLKYVEKCACFYSFKNENIYCKYF